MNDYGRLPQELRERGSFFVWKYEMRKGSKPEDKPTKVAYNFHTGKKADPTTKADTSSFVEAVDASCHYDGIGFGVFDGFSAVDIDHCIDEGGNYYPMARDIIDTMKSYTEISPSGKGVRILFKASGFQYDKKKYYINKRKIGLEVYVYGATKKYLTLTGNTVGEYCTIEERSAELQVILDKYMLREVAPPKPTGAKQPAPGLSLSDTEIIAKASAAANGHLFAALWNGDTSGSSSHSEADLALCNLLAFWCGRDPAQMDRLFRESGLMREKWDEQHGQDTYGDMTIAKAIEGCREVYAPKKRNTTAREDFAPIEEAWSAPIPFDTVDTPNFPTESLPAPVEAFVEALAESTQTYDEMAAVLSLGVLSTAFQRRYEVEITPDWREPLCLYTVTIAAPGERKSGVISALTSPIYDYEAGQRELEASEIEWNKSEKDMLYKALEAAKSTAAKDKNLSKREQARHEAMDLSEQIAAFQEKHPLRLLVDDTTPEKLVDLMNAQSGCITIVSSEGGVFDSLSGRYDKGANFDVYLKGHAGDPIAIDRIGRKSNYIKHPKLSMILTIQPEVLSGLMQNATFRGRGLCGRFLYAVCKSNVGKRKIDTRPIPPEVRAAYNQFVQRILSGTETGIIYLGEEAQALRREYAAYIETRLGRDWEHISKLDDRTRSVMRGYYLEGRSTGSLAAQEGCGISYIAQLRRQGLAGLRRSRELRKYVEDNTDYSLHVGVSRYQNTHTSAVEELVFQRERLAREWKVEKKKPTRAKMGNVPDPPE